MLREDGQMMEGSIPPLFYDPEVPRDRRREAHFVGMVLMIFIPGEFVRLREVKRDVARQMIIQMARKGREVLIESGNSSMIDGEWIEQYLVGKADHYVDFIRKMSNDDEVFTWIGDAGRLLVSAMAKDAGLASEFKSLHDSDSAFMALSNTIALNWEQQGDAHVLA